MWWLLSIHHHWYVGNCLCDVGPTAMPIWQRTKAEQWLHGWSIVLENFQCWVPSEEYRFSECQFYAVGRLLTRGVNKRRTSMGVLFLSLLEAPVYQASSDRCDCATAASKICRYVSRHNNLTKQYHLSQASPASLSCKSCSYLRRSVNLDCCNNYSSLSTQSCPVIVPFFIFFCRNCP